MHRTMHVAYWAPLKSAYSRALRQIKGVGQGSWSGWSGILVEFIYSGYFYSASSSPLLLRGAPDYCVDTCVRDNTPKRYRQLRVKDLPELPTSWLEWVSNL